MNARSGTRAPISQGHHGSSIKGHAPQLVEVESISSTRATRSGWLCSHPSICLPIHESGEHSRWLALISSLRSAPRNLMKADGASWCSSARTTSVTNSRVPQSALRRNCNGLPMSSPECMIIRVSLSVKKASRHAMKTAR